MSDHGQSLGENGIFMHSAPFDTAPVDQKNPAFFIWLNKNAEESFNINKVCMKKKLMIKYHKIIYFIQYLVCQI